MIADKRRSKKSGSACDRAPWWLPDASKIAM